MAHAKHAGWLARVTTVGAQPFLRDFYVYELDKQRALMLVRFQAHVSIGEQVTLLDVLTENELATYGVRPGEVKRRV
jgi:hypothetical protein